MAEHRLPDLDFNSDPPKAERDTPAVKRACGRARHPLRMRRDMFPPLSLSGRGACWVPALGEQAYTRRPALLSWGRRVGCVPGSRSG